MIPIGQFPLDDCRNACYAMQFYALACTALPGPVFKRKRFGECAVWLASSIREPGRANKAAYLPDYYSDYFAVEERDFFFV